MTTRLTVTDLTRSYLSDIGIAGYTEARECVRLVRRGSALPQSLITRRQALVVAPFAVIELVLLNPAAQPPFTEDHYFDPTTLKFLYFETQREEVLYWSLFKSVEAVFEQEVVSEPEYHVLPGRGPRSLGTIAPERLIRVIYDHGHAEQYIYRLAFIDGARRTYTLEVADLAWRCYCDHLRAGGVSPRAIGKALTERLRKARLFLRLGLERRWQSRPPRCFLQITGIYTVPDYLGGLSLADLLLKQG